MFCIVSLGHADFIHNAEPCVLDFAAGLAQDFFEQNFTQIVDELSIWGNNSKEYVKQMCIQPPDVIRGYLGQLNAVSLIKAMVDPGFLDDGRWQSVLNDLAVMILARNVGHWGLFPCWGTRFFSEC